MYIESRYASDSGTGIRKIRGLWARQRACGKIFRPCISIFLTIFSIWYLSRKQWVRLIGMLEVHFSSELDIYMRYTIICIWPDTTPQSFFPYPPYP